jgi:hypothetical protein
MKLYYVRSTVEAFHGYRDVCLTWFMWDRRVQPVLPYAEAIRDYAEIVDDEQRCCTEDYLDEHFTESEAQQVLAWLNQNRRAKHEIIEAGITPITARNDRGSWNQSFSSIPVGGVQDFLMLNKGDWKLPFKIAGYYDLRQHELLDPAVQEHNQRGEGKTLHRTSTAHGGTAQTEAKKGRK